MKEYIVKVYDDGDKYWHLHGKRHREGGPAIECSNGYKVWYLHGKRHREDGPAVEYVDGTKEWYLNGVEMTEDKFLQRNQEVVVLNGKRYRLID